MSYLLQTCVWEITLACCFSCKYCGSKAGRARKDELRTEECLHIADQLADLGCYRVALIGGEVFMHPDWFQIAQRLTLKGIRVSIITNGFLLSKDILHQMHDVGIESLAVSIDGTEEIHDRYRQTGSFKRAIAAVLAASSNSIPVSVISTLNAENVRTLEALYLELCRLPIFAWQMQACSPMGNAAALGVDYRFDPHIVIDFIRDHLHSAPFSLGIADNIGYYSKEEGYLRGSLSGKAFFRGCRAGLTSIGIDSRGNVRGCESMYEDRFIEGNLREKTLREIWENPDGFAYNRHYTKSLLTGICKSCDYAIYCAGGCRSYNYFVHGKLYEAPRCARAILDGKE